MYDISYMFRHYIAILLVPSERFSIEEQSIILWMGRSQCCHIINYLKDFLPVLTILTTRFEIALSDNCSMIRDSIKTCVCHLNPVVVLIRHISLPVCLLVSILVCLKFIGQGFFKFMFTTSTFSYLYTRVYICILYISKFYLSSTLNSFPKKCARILCQPHEIWQTICGTHYMTSHLRPDSSSGLFL
jgi:hypothetical protein